MSDGHDLVTVLRGDKRLAKVWKSDGTIQDYDKAFQYSVHEAIVQSIHGFYWMLDTSLAKRPHEAIIRGKFVGYAEARKREPDAKKGRTLRRGTCFEDVPKHLFLIEVDQFTTMADPVLEPEAAIAEYVATLPPEFLEISYAWQLSSSAGHASKPGLRAHIWFWSAVPLTSEQLETWAKRVELAADHSVFNTVQLHYVANPVFEEGVVDPVPRRIGFYDGMLGGEVHVDVNPNIAGDDERVQAPVPTKSKLTYPEKIAAEIELDAFARHLRDRGDILGHGPQGKLPINCPNRAEHSPGSNKTSTTLMLPGYTGAMGSKASVVHCMHDHCAGVSQQRFRELVEFVENMADDFEALPPERSSFASLASTSANAVVWLYTLLLCIGAFLIVGRPKIGKSWLLMQLAILLGLGRDFLNYKATGAHAGLCIFAEDTTERIVGRADKLASGRPENVEVWTGAKFRELAQKYSDKLTLVQFIDRYLNQHPEVRFVLIDTESTCRAIWDGERSGNDNQRITTKDYGETREFDELALRRKVFIGLVNHSRKGTGGKNAGQSDPHELINRTNTALAGCSGSIVLADLPGVDPLDAEQRKRLLAVRGRDLDDDLMLVIEQDKSTAGFRNLGKYQEVRQTDAERDVLEAIRELQSQAEDQNGFIGYDEISEELVGVSANAVKMTLRRMRKASRLVWNGMRIETRKGRKGGARLVTTPDIDDLSVNHE